MSLIAHTLAAITAADPEVLAQATDHNADLTKPLGAAGLLEETAIKLCGATGKFPCEIPQKVSFTVFAGDHGVVAQQVSPYPQEVTVQMMANFSAGGACINTLARQFGADVQVVNVGVAVPVPAEYGAIDCCVAAGTKDLSVTSAMTRQQAESALEVGIQLAEKLCEEGYQLLVAGEMGIGNTTPSAALIAAFTGCSAAEATGRGTGISDAMLERKVSVIQNALQLHGLPDETQNPIDVLAKVGGFEHAAMAGFYLGAAKCHIPVILDGVISVSAALVAAALCPQAKDYWIAGHRSAEPGASLALDALGLQPLLSLGQRLGEGTGAATAVPLVQAAARMLREMATFSSAGVSHKQE